MPRERAGGARIGALLDRMRAGLDQDWSLNRMAAEAATSRRGLSRRFRDTVGQSPGTWLTAERVSRARELLETSAAPVEDVAAACGFASAAALRHHFRSVLGIGPVEYRSRFGTVSGPAKAR